MGSRAAQQLGTVQIQRVRKAGDLHRLYAGVRGRLQAQQRIIASQQVKGGVIVGVYAQVNRGQPGSAIRVDPVRRVLGR